MCICLCDHALSALKWVDDSFQTPVVGKVIVFMYVCMIHSKPNVKRGKAPKG